MTMGQFRYVAAVAAMSTCSVTVADFVDWHFESDSTSIAGAEYAVIDVYAQFDNTADTVLNVYNSMISTSTGVEFHHNDLNTYNGSPGRWNIVATASDPDVGVVPENDSFVLIGGPVAGSGNTTSLDPSFNPGTGGVIATNAGWFNTAPWNEQGRVDPVSLRLMVARFVVPVPFVATDLDFAANLGYHKGVGTPVQFAFNGGSGRGPLRIVPFATASPCAADIDGNGLVEGGDLGKLLIEWGNSCCGSDIDGDGDVGAADIAALLFGWGVSCGPVIGSIEPAAGSSAGGTEVTITGRHLAAATSVSIGGADAEIVSASSDAIVVLTPPGEVGLAECSVVTPFGSMADAGSFEYLSPLPWATILEVNPDPKIVTDPDLLAAIMATGLPWRVRDNASQIEMLLVPPGTFMMGCSPSNQFGCESNESPVHEVMLTQALYLGRYEVTQAQWTAVMGSNPSNFQGPSSQVPAEQVANRPVEQVSWNMIQGFEATTGLRLPTEAEWEYACRAGTQTAFNLPPNGTNDDGSLGQLAWFSSNSASQTRPVGQKQANNLGLHDMHGNVLELVEDAYGEHYYTESPTVDPIGPMKSPFRVIRGGSWSFIPAILRTSYRNGTTPDNSNQNLGFRIAKTP